MKGKKKIQILAVTGFVLVLLLVLFFVLCSVKSVAVKGSQYYSEEDIKKKLMTEPTDGNAVLFWLRYHTGQGNDVPFIQQVDIELKSMSSVEITVYEKRMTGCIRNMGEYVYFDKDGTVMEVSKDKLDGITLFTGLAASSYTLYSQLKVENTDIFRTILSLSQLIERYALAIDKVHIANQSGVTMYSGKVTIELGEQQMYDEAVAELNHMLPKVLELNQKGTIDMKGFKAGQATIIFKPEEK